jgi:CspA family cold shock protein
MSTDSATTSAVTSPSQKFTGRVKWFNTRAGYGFITITDGPKSGSDVFVHHSSINVENEQYRYLVQGEYVEFTLSDVMKDGHEYQAGEVSGIKGGKLMCETRREVRTARTQYRTTKGGEEEFTPVANKKSPVVRRKPLPPRTPEGPPRVVKNVSPPRAPMKSRKPRA